MADDITGYDAFAVIYDRHWGRFATDVLPVLDRLAFDDLDPVAHVLDLCCGSGQLAAALIDRGHRVTGVDASPEMIRIARDNAPRARFVVADARAFELETPADAAVSTFDSLNHFMSLDALADVFGCVHDALRPGARFVFDLNTEEGFQARWRGSFGLATDREVVVARSSYESDERVGRMHLTLMTPTGELWERRDVTLSQTAHGAADVRDALRSAGFEDIAVYDARDDLGFESVGRVFFACARDEA